MSSFLSGRTKISIAVLLCLVALGAAFGVGYQNRHRQAASQPQSTAAEDAAYAKFSATTPLCTTCEKPQ